MQHGSANQSSVLLNLKFFGMHKNDFADKALTRTTIREVRTYLRHSGITPHFYDLVWVEFLFSGYLPLHTKHNIFLRTMYVVGYDSIST